MVPPQHHPCPLVHWPRPTTTVVQLNNRLILNRMREAINPSTNQNGLRGKTQNSLSVSRSVKTHRGGEKEQHACLASAGWKMLKILKTYRIPPHLLGVTKSTYTNTTSCVVPPFILIIVLNYVNPHEDLGFTITPSKSRRVGPVHLSHPDVADDTEDAPRTSGESGVETVQ